MLYMKPSEHFRTFGYVVIKDRLSEQDREFLFQYILVAARRRETTEGDRQVPGSPAGYADIVTETLLERLLPIVEGHLQLTLFPTYSYFRLYKNGATLRKHTDRPACEISGTLCLGYEPDRVWPIWIEVKGKAIPIGLEPGDLLLYRGIDVPHWREAFEGDYMAQVFLHYVDQLGPCREWQFDKRDGLRRPPVPGPRH